eukprot:7270578-Prymnesium_polylepis.1
MLERLWSLLSLLALVRRSHGRFKVENFHGNYSFWVAMHALWFLLDTLGGISEAPRWVLVVDAILCCCSFGLRSVFHFGVWRDLPDRERQWDICTRAFVLFTVTAPLLAFISRSGADTWQPTPSIFANDALLRNDRQPNGRVKDLFAALFVLTLSLLPPLAGVPLHYNAGVLFISSLPELYAVPHELECTDAAAQQQVAFLYAVVAPAIGSAIAILLLGTKRRAFAAQ